MRVVQNMVLQMGNCVSGGAPIQRIPSVNTRVTILKQNEASIIKYKHFFQLIQNIQLFAENTDFSYPPNKI